MGLLAAEQPDAAVCAPSGVKSGGEVADVCVPSEFNRCAEAALIGKAC
eukprot:CAMPEP_0115882444 /NCGR_PEP_ID=MMETSP0287-20121206/29009_1 /TAXON_ID=412157 /ORGANISM="Chrysochromulina rotalis, Strain UIO044" /LENGTH=47 /DNA_ID= /DNA_START= /DNA_END= /DNA_ORIENTATION=